MPLCLKTDNHIHCSRFHPYFIMYAHCYQISLDLKQKQPPRKVCFFVQSTQFTIDRKKDNNNKVEKEFLLFVCFCFLFKKKKKTPESNENTSCASTKCSFSRELFSHFVASLFSSRFFRFTFNHEIKNQNKTRSKPTIFPFLLCSIYRFAYVWLTHFHQAKLKKNTRHAAALYVKINEKPFYNRINSI